MTWKMLFTSSIGKKFIMSLTGIFLITFLIIHAGINSCIFLNDNGATFNTAAHFMSHNWIIRFMEIGLFAGLLLHIIQGLVLWKQNRSARTVKYAMSDASKNSTWYSRSMGLLGTLLLFFLIIHISKFFVSTKIALYSGDRPHNLYEEMKDEFSKWWVVAIYIAGIISLFWHLLHGFQSAFQTLGINHKKYTPIIKTIGIGYTVIISILFILMPLAFYFRWIE
ncbi:MAG: succinate dehydrogenase cytochrome b subunit [Chitinophagaceae bacterium]|nr:succinate dehydrogenase cytochrome b subunit [Chitinophagaceae bacterium]